MCVGSSYRGLSIGKVEVADVPVVVDVDAQQRVGLDVAEVVGTEHHAMPNLALDAEVDLHRAWSLVTGGDDSEGDTQPRIEEVANIVRIWSLKIQRISRFVLAPERQDRGYGVASVDVETTGTGRGSDGAGRHRHRLRYTAETGVRGLIEGSREQT